jgi:hypothetical protein
VTFINGRVAELKNDDGDGALIPVYIVLCPDQDIYNYNFACGFVWV